MKNIIQLKKPFGKADFSRVKHARYLGWEDAFDVEFEDGLCFLEPHAIIRKANRIASGALPVRVEVDEELGSHFRILYDNDQVAEVSWSFIRELPAGTHAKTLVSFGKGAKSHRRLREAYGQKFVLKSTRNPKRASALTSTKGLLT